MSVLCEWLVHACLDMSLLFLSFFFFFRLGLCCLGRATGIRCMKKHLSSRPRHDLFSHRPVCLAPRSFLVPRSFPYSSFFAFVSSFLFVIFVAHFLFPFSSNHSTQHSLNLLTYHYAMSKDQDASKAMDANQDVQPPPPSYAATSGGNTSYAPPTGAPPGDSYYQAQPVGGQTYASPGGYTPPEGPPSGHAPPAGPPSGYTPPAGPPSAYAPPAGPPSGYAPPRK